LRKKILKTIKKIYFFPKWRLSPCKKFFGYGSDRNTSILQKKRDWERNSIPNEIGKDGYTSLNFEYYSKS